MKVHLIKKLSIMLFVARHARSRVSFEDWLEKIKYADWNSPSDIQKTFVKADFIGKRSQRMVFDIGGNEYRMICRYVFGEKNIHLFICWIGTHPEYMKRCKRNMQYAINMF